MPQFSTFLARTPLYGVAAVLLLQHPLAAEATLKVPARAAAVALNRAGAVALNNVADQQPPLWLANQALAQEQGTAECVTKGLEKYKSGDSLGEIVEFNKAIAIDPRDTKVYAGRGHAKEERGNWDGAIADFTKAIALDPGHANSYFSRGMIKAAKDDRQGAIKDFDQAIAINPKDGKTYWNRGVSKSLLGDKVEGCLDYRTASELGEATAASDLDFPAWNLVPRPVLMTIGRSSVLRRPQVQGIGRLRRPLLQQRRPHQQHQAAALQTSRGIGEGRGQRRERLIAAQAGVDHPAPAAG